MAVDYATLKKGGFMRQKQKNNFSLRLRVVGATSQLNNLRKLPRFRKTTVTVMFTSHQDKVLKFLL